MVAGEQSPGVTGPTEPFRACGPDPGTDDVAAFREGDRDAAERIFRATWKALYRVSHRLLLDADAAQENAQAAFVRAWKARDAFRGTTTEALAAWLVTSARHRALDQLRRRKRQVPLEGANLHAAPGEGPEERLEAVETRDEVRRALEDLEPGDRAALVLFEIEEQPQAEIASAMEISVGAFKVRLHRARRRFREAYMRIVTSRHVESEPVASVATSGEENAS